MVVVAVVVMAAVATVAVVVAVVVKAAVATVAAVVAKARPAAMMVISAAPMVAVRVKTADLQDATSINLPV
jgi:hypothetical protein